MKMIYTDILAALSFFLLLKVSFLLKNIFFVMKKLLML